MRAPMIALTVGASIGVGALSVPVVGSVLAKPITGEVVPTRITDLAGYLTGSGASGKGLGFEDEESQSSFGSVDNSNAARAPASPTVPAPASGVQGNTTAPSASADSKRMLAVASFGAGLLIAFTSFVLIRRVLS